MSPKNRNNAGCRIRDSGGFSLIELLVVIAIMGIVSSLVLPHAARLKARVKSVQCGQNLRQWGLATHLFIQDSDGWLPPDGSSNGRSTRAGWYIDLPPYVNLPPYSQWPWRTNSTQRPPQSAYLCPSNRRISDGVNLFHYTLNRHVNGSGAGLRVRLDQVRSPVQTIWLFDNGRKAAVASRSNLHTNLHLNGANILLLDGHVEHRDRGDYIDGETGEPKGRIGELIWEP